MIAKRLLGSFARRRTVTASLAKFQQQCKTQEIHAQAVKFAPVSAIKTQHRLYSSHSHFSSALYYQEFIAEAFRRSFKEMRNTLSTLAPFEEKFSLVSTQFMFFEKAIHTFIKTEENGWIIPLHRQFDKKTHNEHHSQKNHEFSKEDEIDPKKFKFIHAAESKILHNCEKALREAKKHKDFDHFVKCLAEMEKALQDHLAQQKAQLLPSVQTALPEKEITLIKQQAVRDYKTGVTSAEYRFEEHDKETEDTFVVPKAFERASDSFRLCEVIVRELLKEVQISKDQNAKKQLTEVRQYLQEHKAWEGMLGKIPELINDEYYVE